MIIQVVYSRYLVLADQLLFRYETTYTKANFYPKNSFDTETGKQDN
jgi:hypothetical protein